MTISGKPVLVATDLSARCDRAVDRAVMLAIDWHTRLKVVHVLEAGAKVAGDLALARKIVRVALPNPDADVDILLPKGSAPEEIARAASETGSGIIVTGVARYNHVGDYLLGTAVDHVVRHADVPVLVVKQRPRGPYRRILAATDFSSPSRAALLKAAELFPDAAIDLVHAYHVPYEAWLNSDEVRSEIREEAQQELSAFLNDPALPESLRQRITARLDYGETDRVMATALAETNADLVVLGTHGCSGLAHAAIGSTAASLLSWVNADTLMVRQLR